MTREVSGPYCVIHDAAHRPCDPLDAGMISDMERPIVLSPDDADDMAALLEERPGPTEVMLALFAERRPCAGWVMAADGRLVLDGGKLVAKVRDHGYVNTFGHGATWAILLASDRAVTMRLEYAPTLEAAQLAAEDALLAVADEILRAVGR